MLRIKEFFLEDLWDINIASLSKTKRFFLHQIRIVYLVAHGFIEQKCMLRASALTYSSLLSIVPVLALMFSLAKGFGVQNRLRPLIVDNLTAGTHDVAVKIIEYVDNTDAKALGTIGLAVLIFSVINVLGNIEKSFNDIWGIKRQRTIFRKFSDYLSVVIVGPVLVAVATGVTASLSSNMVVQKLMESGLFEKTFKFALMVAPYLSLCIAFTCIYIFMPNTKVNFLSALTGGITGGGLWQISQWGYIHFQIGVSKYNAIYGTFASFPIFLVWMYISWLIVLFGAQVSFIHQHKEIQYSQRGMRLKNVSFSDRMTLALLVTRSICCDFYSEKKKKVSKGISEELHLPVTVINELLEQLCQIGILTEVPAADNPYYLPSKSPEQIKIKDVLTSFKQYGEMSGVTDQFEKSKKVCNVLKKIEKAGDDAAGDMSMKDLI